ncbi:MAG: sigma-70 family RNA polymerase sigma factor [Ruminiclostridium sp.]|nr:sigma-70 family RNA polymerase sigma factor [Ruminiclostridium sp.]
MKVTDEELVGIIRTQPDPLQSGETALLISRYSPVIRLKAAKLRNKDIESEDLCQEGYLALFDAIRAYDSTKGTFSAFAGRCISNRMINSAAKARGRLEKADNFDFTLVPDSAAPTDDYLISKEDDTAVTEKMLTLLSKKEYNVFRLHLDGYSYRQIAEKLGIPPKSADNALSRAKKKLKELL